MYVVNTLKYRKNKDIPAGNRSRFRRQEVMEGDFEDKGKPVKSLTLSKEERTAMCKLVRALCYIYDVNFRIFVEKRKLDIREELNEKF